MSKYFQAPWSLKDVLTVVIVVIITILAVDFALLSSELDIFFKNIIKSEDQSFWLKELIILSLFFVQSIVLVIPIVILSIKKYKKFKFSNFGFGKFKIFTHISQAILGYLLYLGISSLISIFIIYAGVKIPGYQISEPILPIFGNTNFAMAVAAMVVIGIAPILEEIFFRGFVLQGLVNKVGKIWGAIATALLFAVFHLQFQSFIPIFILGLILSFLFIRSKSIWPCIWFHIINNIVAFAVELMMLRGIIPLDF